MELFSSLSTHWHGDGVFTESGGWQYRFYVPHDVDGLAALYGGNSILCSKIEEMLSTRTGPAYHVGGYGGPIHEQKEAQAVFDKGFGYYAHNNQPVHHVLYVAKKAGCNRVGDLYIRKTMKELYTLSGYAGDEDNGEMAAWYLLSAIGLYQLEGAADELVVGNPAVISATLPLPKGKTLRVTTEGQHNDINTRVKSVTWTPQDTQVIVTVQGNVIKFSEVMAGGTLHFVLAPAGQVDIVV